MKAYVQTWKLWEQLKVKLEYPMLILEASKEEAEETQALIKLGEICKGLFGKGYNNRVAAINNPDTRHLRTSFAIDIGTLLTLCAEFSSDRGNKEAAKQFAIGWLKNLADSHKSRGKDKVSEDLMCRCGQVFKTEKVRKSHVKRCSVIQHDMPILRRVQASLKALKKKKVSSDGYEKSQTRKLQYPKSPDIRCKASGKISKEDRRKSRRDVRRAKAGRLTRRSNSKK